MKIYLHERHESERQDYREFSHSGKFQDAFGKPTADMTKTPSVKNVHTQVQTVESLTENSHVCVRI